MGIFLGCMQQLCGINVIFAYSGKIFSEMNLSSINSYQGSAIIGFFNAIAVLGTGKMLYSFGRKTLMVAFGISMAVCLLLMAFATHEVKANPDANGWNYVKLGVIIAFVTFFEFSAGPIVWLYNAEIMTDQALTVATAFNWIANMLVGLLTPHFLTAYPVGIYIFYATYTLVSAFIL